MTAYSIKIALRGISPMIWRRLRLPGSTSIADFHHVIQISMGWDDEYLHCFHIYGKDYGISYESGLSFSDNPHNISLSDFSFDVGDRFTYCYNFFDNYLCDIRIEDIQVNEKNSDPFCRGGQGRIVNNKRCYRGCEAMALIDVLDTIFNGDEATTTVGDVRKLIEVYEAKRFDRSAINGRLASTLSEVA